LKRKQLFTEMKLTSILSAFACLFGTTHGCYSFQTSLDETINVVEDTMEILVLGRYFLRDTESYGRALFDNVQRFYVDSVALFRIDENGNEVVWWRGISVDDIISVKNQLLSVLYEVYRYVDRVVDYIDDISENACGITLLDTIGQNATEFIYDIVPQLDPWQPGNFTLTPCAFDRDAIMAQAAVVVDVQEWIESNFEFFELFWETYGRFL